MLQKLTKLFQERDWVKKTFKKRECIKFIPTTRNSKKNQLRFDYPLFKHIN